MNEILWKLPEICWGKLLFGKLANELLKLELLKLKHIVELRIRLAMRGTVRPSEMRRCGAQLVLLMFIYVWDCIIC